MIKMSLQRLPENHLGSREQKCSSRGFLKAIWAAGLRNTQNELPEASREAFGQQRPETAKCLSSPALYGKKEEVSILLLDLGPLVPPQGGPQRARPLAPAR